jgi:predicted MFS family arabinose efflux permease
VDIRPRIILFTVVRTILNTAHRLVYPFLAVFARGLGVDLYVISGMVANRAILGAAVPFIFPFIESRGRKFGMLLGLCLFIFAMGIVAFSPSLTTFGLSLILTMLGKAFFDPSSTSYVADHVSYEKRGRAIGVMEFSWSFAFILGIPFMGWLISTWTWSTPYWILGSLGLLSLIVIAITLRDSGKPAPHANGTFGSVKEIFTSPIVLISLSIGMFVSCGNEVVNLMFGVWLEDSFHVKIAALAGAAAIIGLSELGGEGLVVLFVDRIGKVRATGIGIIANCVAALLLPIIGQTQAGALVGLFLFFITFEFTIVSIIPLISEVNPSARATTLSFGAAGHFIGRAAGALLAPLLYSIGFFAVTGAAILFNLVGLLAVWYVSKHHE